MLHIRTIGSVHSTVRNTMESLSVAELYEILYTIHEAGTMQFQYWLALTFALIGATYVAGEKISVPLKLGVGFVYVCATILFILLYSTAGEDFSAVVTELRGRGLKPPTGYGLFVILMRFVIWGSGTLLALFFLFRKPRDAGA